MAGRIRVVLRPACQQCRSGGTNRKLLEAAIVRGLCNSLGRRADMIYSLEATNTDLHAWPFKPVLKMLNAPTGNLPIADEVSLGKTIESGLIRTELKARSPDRILVVLCPPALRENRRFEITEAVPRLLADVRKMLEAD